MYIPQTSAMTATIVSRTNESFILQVEVPVKTDNMLFSENSLQQALNEAGRLGTGELLNRFETPNKTPIVVRGRKLTYKHSVTKLL